MHDTKHFLSQDEIEYIELLELLENKIVNMSENDSTKIKAQLTSLINILKKDNSITTNTYSYPELETNLLNFKKTAIGNLLDFLNNNTADKIKPLYTKKPYATKGVAYYEKVVSPFKYYLLATICGVTLVSMFFAIALLLPLSMVAYPLLAIPLSLSFVASLALGLPSSYVGLLGVTDFCIALFFPISARISDAEHDLSIIKDTIATKIESINKSLKDGVSNSTSDDSQITTASSTEAYSASQDLLFFSSTSSGIQKTTASPTKYSSTGPDLIVFEDKSTSEGQYLLSLTGKTMN